MQVVVADAATRSRTLLEQSETLASLQRSATAAFALYRRTRPAAAPQSVVRAKALPAEGIHPLLAAHVPLNALAGLEDQVHARLDQPQKSFWLESCMAGKAPGGSRLSWCRGSANCGKSGPG